MKKLLRKTFLYLLILVSIPYCYLLWQAKQGVDTFLLAYDLGGEIQYEWFWVDLNGRITLYNLTFLKDERDPLLESEFVHISLPSVFDLINSKERVVYKEFPAELSISLVNAVSNQGSKIPSVFGLNYNSSYLTLFYPKECQNDLEKEIPRLKFNAETVFQIQRTADISDVEFDFESLDFANIKGKFKINNFSQNAVEGSFISDLSFNISDVSWLQKNTQKCLVLLNNSRQEFLNKLSNQVIANAAAHQLVFEQSTPQIIADFLYAPLELEISIDVDESKKLSQIPLDPIYLLPERLGLMMVLNDKPLNVIFDQSKSESFELKVIEEEKQKEEVATALPVENQQLKTFELKQYLGSKLLISLHSGKVIEGYLQSVENGSLELVQRRFKGKTVVPFNYKDIKKITLINPEN